jgi:hypothetical protein
MLVLAEYDEQQGAWLDGHKPKQPPPSRLPE